MDYNLNNNIQLKKKQKKMVRTSSCVSNGDILIYEILTRLPVKTLSRFKTVCKEWCSLIEKDQNFIHSHLLTHSKTRSTCRIFIVVPVPLPEGEIEEEDPWGEISLWPYEEFYITADLVFEDNGSTMKAIVDTVREVDSSSYDMITKPPINGLFCCIESQLEHAVRICNISTRQVSPSFQSTLSQVFRRRKCESFQYGFGFDSDTNEHKLVCVWQRHHRIHGPLSFICEVLTLGHQGGINSWRSIDDVPPPHDELTDDSVYVNGVIYWSTYNLKNGWWDSEFGPTRIVAFDVGREKFRTITVPDLTLCGAPHHFRDDLRYDSQVNLLEVSGHLAMLVKVNHCVFKMYMYSSSNDERWIEVKSITLPLHLEENCVKFHTFVGSDDKIIVTFYDRGNCRKNAGKKKCSSFYCFNWKKDSWTEFEVSGIPSRVPHICFNSSFTTFTESLLPVNN